MRYKKNKQTLIISIISMKQNRFNIKIYDLQNEHTQKNKTKSKTKTMTTKKNNNNGKLYYQIKQNKPKKTTNKL